MPEIKTHAEWLQAQLKGIGASEASAIVGQNPYMSNVDLWRIKVGPPISAIRPVWPMAMPPRAQSGSYLPWTTLIHTAWPMAANLI